MPEMKCKHHIIQTHVYKTVQFMLKLLSIEK